MLSLSIHTFLNVYSFNKFTVFSFVVLLKIVLLKFYALKNKFNLKWDVVVWRDGKGCGVVRDGMWWCGEGWDVVVW